MTELLAARDLVTWAPGAWPFDWPWVTDDWRFERAFERAYALLAADD